MGAAQWPIIIPPIMPRLPPIQPRGPRSGYALGWTALQWSDYWFDLADRPFRHTSSFPIEQCERNGVMWLACHCGLREAPTRDELSAEVNRPVDGLGKDGA